MPFRATFSCLWCGADHVVRGPDDIEGWAQLCPTCVGRAGDDGFRRFRLRSALEERGRARGPAAAHRAAPRPGPTDDWYLRRGSYANGAIEDAMWAGDLDAATLWLDGLPLAGSLAQLAAGDGWWAPLLAGKGELWVHDSDGAALDRARERLLAHGLRAHLHVRDPWAEPDRRVDALVATFWLGRLDPADMPDWLALGRRWLAAGGRLVLLELAGAEDQPGPPGSPGPGPLAPGPLRRVLDRVGFESVEVQAGGAILRCVARA